MDFILSKHAADQFKVRQIDFVVVEKVMNTPDTIITEEPCKHIFQKGIEVNGKCYLYRIFVNVCKTPALIITGYRTSKIEKYEN